MPCSDKSQINGNRFKAGDVVVAKNALECSYELTATGEKFTFKMEEGQAVTIRAAHGIPDGEVFDVYSLMEEATGELKFYEYAFSTPQEWATRFTGELILSDGHVTSATLMLRENEG